MSLSTRIGAAIPAYQAAPSVGAVIRGTLALVPDPLAELVVIDDGSSDGTGDAARAAGARVLVQPRNLGKGAALRLAFADLLARGCDGVVTLDADGQHLAAELPKLLPLVLEGADLVLGVRDHLFGEMSRVRRASNRLSSRAISFAAGRPVPDIQTGFRYYSRRLIETVGFPEDRFEAESAVVVRAARRNLRIAAVPVHLGFADGRTTSHYRPLVDSLRIARAVIAARFEGE
ncbi:MAG TPA: glycosyltransferase family 2 protein [Thermoanaerobaculia bacterium]|nr:glycosyltransferase family 2 protein [Thermoanaerobaculia bacterium]